MGEFEDAQREYDRLLEGARGKSIEELIALTKGDTVDFLFSLELAVQQKAERVGDENLSDEERIVLAVENLEREVNNGGYSQFFVNSSVRYAPVIVDALVRIGCPVTAKITEEAIQALGLDSLSPEAAEQAANAADDSLNEALDGCDQRYYRAGENIGGQLIEFVKAHPEAIRP